MSISNEDGRDRQGKPKVGYRNPPMDYCFPPGTSGNPNGRPKGSKNKPVRIDGQRAGDMIIEEAFRTVKVRDNGAIVEMPLYRASIRKMAIQAASGNTRAARYLLYAVSDVLRRRDNADESYRDFMAKYMVETRAVIAERMAKNLPIDDIIPHPDDIMWDGETGLPYIVDPATLPSLDENRNMLVAANTLLSHLKKELTKAKSSEDLTALREQLAKLLEYRRTVELAIKRQEYQANRDDPKSR
jgi:hypothetical protein